MLGRKVNWEARDKTAGSTGDCAVGLSYLVVIVLGDYRFSGARSSHLYVKSSEFCVNNP